MLNFTTPALQSPVTEALALIVPDAETPLEDNETAYYMSAGAASLQLSG